MTLNACHAVAHLGVAAGAEGYEVIHVCCAALGPVVDVVNFEETGMRAAWHGALVAPHRKQCPNLPIRGKASRASNVKGEALAIEQVGAHGGIGDIALQDP